MSPAAALHPAQARTQPPPLPASPLVEIEATHWAKVPTAPAWQQALEAGKVLYFPRLAFELLAAERPLLRPEFLAPKSRNISLSVDGTLQGATGDAPTQAALAALIGRFRQRALGLVDSLLPHYTPALRIAPTSFHPMQVQTRSQSWRADDRRLHVDAFPSRPNYGERILQVFANINPNGQPRLWRLGEPFEAVAQRFLPSLKPYVPWQARLLNALQVTKSLRSEYDHLMLQLHDAMKRDMAYQQNCPQQAMPFPAGSVWVCFSDQATHAVMAGQYMLEQTLHVPAKHAYDPHASPLAIWTRLVGRPLRGLQGQ